MEKVLPQGHCIVKWVYTTLASNYRHLQQAFMDFKAKRWIIKLLPAMAKPPPPIHICTGRWMPALHWILAGFFRFPHDGTGSYTSAIKEIHKVFLPWIGVFLKDLWYQHKTPATSTQNICHTKKNLSLSKPHLCTYSMRQYWLKFTANRKIYLGRGMDS